MFIWGISTAISAAFCCKGLKCRKLKKRQELSNEIFSLKNVEVTKVCFLNLFFDPSPAVYLLLQRLTPEGEAAAMNTQQMEQMGQFRITVWEEENFQGKRCEFMLECQNIMERGFHKIRSIKVENGP